MHSIRTTSPGRMHIPIIIRFLVSDLAPRIFDFPKTQPVPLKWSPPSNIVPGGTGGGQFAKQSPKTPHLGGQTRLVPRRAAGRHRGGGRAMPCFRCAPLHPGTVKWGPYDEAVPRSPPGARGGFTCHQGAVKAPAWGWWALGLWPLELATNPPCFQRNTRDRNHI